MTSGSEEFDRPEPSFADVMNAFSFDSGRSSRRRRRGRRDGGGAAADQDAGAAPTGPGTAAPPVSRPEVPDQRWPGGASVDYPLPVPRPEVSTPEPDEPEEVTAAAVRPYAWTRGRTKSGFDLAIETLLSTSQRGREQMRMMPVEHRAVAQLCEQTRSVAEVAALLRIPLGVARVLLGDMAGLGLVLVHQTVTSASSGPDLALMERVLSGLRRL